MTLTKLSAAPCNAQNQALNWLSFRDANPPLIDVLLVEKMLFRRYLAQVHTEKAPGFICMKRSAFGWR
jgi:hypothetical protein